MKRVDITRALELRNRNSDRVIDYLASLIKSSAITLTDMVLNDEELTKYFPLTISDSESRNKANLGLRIYANDDMDKDLIYESSITDKDEDNRSRKYVLHNRSSSAKYSDILAFEEQIPIKQNTKESRGFLKKLLNKLPGDSGDKIAGYETKQFIKFTLHRDCSLTVVRKNGEYEILVSEGFCRGDHIGDESLEKVIAYFKNKEVRPPKDLRLLSDIVQYMGSCMEKINNFYRLTNEHLFNQDNIKQIVQNTKEHIQSFQQSLEEIAKGPMIDYEEKTAAEIVIIPESYTWLLENEIYPVKQLLDANEENISILADGVEQSIRITQKNPTEIGVTHLTQYKKDLTTGLKTQNFKDEHLKELILSTICPQIDSYIEEYINPVKKIKLAKKITVDELENELPSPPISQETKTVKKQAEKIPKKKIAVPQ